MHERATANSPPDGPPLPALQAGVSNQVVTRNLNAPHPQESRARSRLAAVILCGLFLHRAIVGIAAELTAAAVADPKGDGPDAKGNTADDTWQFWFQLVGSPQYRRLDLATSTIPDSQRKAGIRDEKARHGKQKVQGPIGSLLPNPATTEGWIFHSDWDARYEGFWGETKANRVIAHPYNEKTDAGAVAVTYKVPADGHYTISAKIADLQINKSGHPLMDGITYIIDIVDAGEFSITTANPPLKQGKVGDSAGPESEKFQIDDVALKKGRLLRLTIQPNKSWSTDMTMVELKIDMAK